MKHWMEHGFLNMTSSKAATVEDDIVILMDPDMILLRPLTHDFSDVDQHLWVTTSKQGRRRQQQHQDSSSTTTRTRVVRHGFPMAQQDGYLTNSWMDLNATYIMGTPHHPPIPKSSHGPLYWNTGPPYLATVRTFSMFCCVPSPTIHKNKTTRKPFLYRTHFFYFYFSPP